MSGHAGALDAFRTWNEEMVRKYDPDRFHNHGNPLIRWVEKRRVDSILHLLAPSEQDRVLEVGCGAGNILDRIPGSRRHGTDVSPTMIAATRHRLADASLTLSAGEQLPYRAGSFDKVYCSEVLEHVVDPHAVFAEMLRVTRPGGRVVVSVPNEAVINACKKTVAALGLRRLFASDNGYASPDRMDDEWHLRAFSPAVLRSVIGPASSNRAVPHSLLPLRLIAVLDKP